MVDQWPHLQLVLVEMNYNHQIVFYIVQCPILVPQFGHIISLSASKMVVPHSQLTLFMMPITLGFMGVISTVHGDYKPTKNWGYHPTESSKQIELQNPKLKIYLEVTICYYMLHMFISLHIQWRITVQHLFFGALTCQLHLIAIAR